MSKGGRPMMEGVVRYANKRINYAETEKRVAQEQKEKSENDSGNASPRIARERALRNLDAKHLRVFGLPLSVGAANQPERAPLIGSQLTAFVPLERRHEFVDVRFARE